MMVKLRLENIQSRISNKRGVLSSNAGITWNLEDMDFSNKELAWIGLQKGVLGLPKPLKNICHGAELINILAVILSCCDRISHMTIEVNSRHVC